MTFQESWQKILRKSGRRSMGQIQEAVKETTNAGECFAVIRQSLEWVSLVRNVPGFDLQKEGWRGVLHVSFTRLKGVHCPLISSHQEADYPTRMHQLQSLTEHLRHMRELQTRWRRLFRERDMPCAFGHWLTEQETELPHLQQHIEATRNAPRVAFTETVVAI